MSRASRASRATATRTGWQRRGTSRATSASTHVVRVEALSVANGTHAVKCCGSGDGCTATFSLQAAARHATAEAFERLQKNVDEMKTVALQSEFEEWKQQYEADFQAKSERERKLTAARKAIEGMLDVRCPRCRMVFDEFTGCAALTCAYKGCKCNFCALCLKDTGGDAHAHVKTCKLNPRRGEYFVSTEEWEAIMRERRRAEVRAYWVEMVDPSLRDELRDAPTVKQIRDDLGLDADMAQPPAARRRRPAPRDAARDGV